MCRFSFWSMLWTKRGRGEAVGHPFVAGRMLRCGETERQPTQSSSPVKSRCIRTLSIAESKADLCGTGTGTGIWVIEGKRCNLFLSVTHPLPSFC